MYDHRGAGAAHDGETLLALVAAADELARAEAVHALPIT